MPITVKHVAGALASLGGLGLIQKNYPAVVRLAPELMSRASREVVRGRLQGHSRESAQYRFCGDYFRSATVWRTAGALGNSPRREDALSPTRKIVSGEPVAFQLSDVRAGQRSLPPHGASI